MTKKRQRWERPDFEERPLGAEVTAYVYTQPTKAQPTKKP